MILLDTHAWIWFVADPDRLSARARAAVNTGIDKRQVLVSSISSWEVAMLVAKGRLALTLPVQDWIAKAEMLPFLNFIAVDNGIALKAVSLPEPLHSDPADRIIIATAIREGAALVTKDQKILDYPHVRTIW